MGLLLALFGFALPLAAALPALSPAEYGGRVAGIERRLGRGDWAGAREEARELAARRVVLEGEEIATDRSVLGPLAAARGRDEALAARPALARLAAALATAGTAGTAETAGPAAGPVAADRRTLEAVRRSQALPEIRVGGGTAPPTGLLAGLRQALIDFLEPPVRFFVDLFERLWNWLAGLFPDKPRATPFGFNLYSLVVALVAAAAIAFALLAWRALSQRRPAEIEAAGNTPAPSRDDDPLSRETSEWERYAEELARAGRAREAVRAWYHAVLVALYRSGLLHYRRGSTNWEYASALPASLAFRPAFHEMTHRFEREWYGHAESSEEALDRARALALDLLQAVRGGRG